MKLRLLVAAAAVAGFLNLTPRASAETLGTIGFTLNDGGTPVVYNPYGKTPAVTTYGGPFHWTQTQPPNTGFPEHITTYCIDLDNYIRTGESYEYITQTDLKVAPTIGNDPAKVAAITELFDRGYLNSLKNANNNAAFQLALWELVYDGATSKSLSAGRIQGDPNGNPTKAQIKAQSLLDSLGTPYSNHDLAGFQLVALISKTGHQDQITVIPNGVPAPPAALLAGIGVLALIGRARLTRKPAATA